MMACVIEIICLPRSRWSIQQISSQNIGYLTRFQASLQLCSEQWSFICLFPAFNESFLKFSYLTQSFLPRPKRFPPKKAIFLPKVSSPLSSYRKKGTLFWPLILPFRNILISINPSLPNTGLIEVGDIPIKGVVLKKNLAKSQNCLTRPRPPP